MELRQPGPLRSRRAAGFCVIGAGLLGALTLTAGSFVAGPVTSAGATNPASLNCGTLEISGTDSQTYQFSEFTTGDAARSGSDAGGSVAYGGTLTASNWSVGNGITPPASQLTTSSAAMRAAS